MKKTYNAPSVIITQLRVNRNLMLTVSNTTVSGDNAGWAKEDNGWWDDED